MGGTYDHHCVAAIANISGEIVVKVVCSEPGESIEMVL